MTLTGVVFFIVGTICFADEAIGGKAQLCGVGEGDCMSGQDVSSSPTTISKLFIQFLTSPLLATFIGLVVFSVYIARTLPGSLYVLRGSQSRVQVAQQSMEGELHELRTRLDEMEHERDDLRVQLDNKRLREKPSELDLASQWQDPPRLGEELARQWAANAPVTPPTRDESASSVDGWRQRAEDDDMREKDDDNMCVRVRKTPSLPIRVRGGITSSIPMRCQTTTPRGIAKDADNSARKYREAQSKLSEAERKIVALTKDMEVMESLRNELNVVVDQRNTLGRRMTVMNREKKDMVKQMGTLQEEAKAVREQFEDLKKQHQALTRQFEQLKNNAKAMARDKRLLGRQLLEAREELEMARAKLDSIHQEKSQLIETLERLTMQKCLDEARSSPSQNDQSQNFSRRKSATSQTMPFRNRFSFGNQRNLPSDQVTEQHKSSYVVLQVSSRKKSANRDVEMSALRATTGVVSKTPKTLEEKSDALVQNRKYSKGARCERLSSRSLSTPPSRTQKSDHQKSQKPRADSNRLQEDAENEKEVGGAVSRRRATKQRMINAREMGTQSSVDITEFAKSLQRLERNVAINMSVRGATAFHVKDRRSAVEKMAVTEIYHNINQEKTEEWESSVDILAESPSKASTTIPDTSQSNMSISDDLKPADSFATVESVDSESQIQVETDRDTDSKTDMDASSCSLCCLDSRCSVCSAAGCPLGHRLCSDLNCMAGCSSSCSSLLPVERSQSIVSGDDESVDVAEASSTSAVDSVSGSAGLASLFGNGPVGEGGPWNLPGFSVAAHTTRPTSSVLAWQGSLGEVAAGGNVMSNEVLARRGSTPAEPELGSEGAAKKLISRFTAANRGEEGTCRRGAGPPSPTLMKFLEELTTLALEDGGRNGDQSDIMSPEQQAMAKEFESSLLAELIDNERDSPSEELSYDHALHSDRSDPSTASTEYFINDDGERLF